MKINLGCGRRVLEGFINCDIRELPGVDEIVDITKRLLWENGVVDEIEASHILEHFEAHKTKKILAEFIRVLKPGGIANIEVPNMGAVFKRWQVADHKEKWFHSGSGDRRFPSLFHYIWGQGNVEGGQCHLRGFDQECLERLMGDAGFINIVETRSRIGHSVRLQGEKPGS